MERQPPRSTRTDPLFASTTLFRSQDTDLAHGMTHEEFLHRRQPLDEPEPEIAGQPERRDVVGEQSGQPIGDGRQHEGVDPAPAGITRSEEHTSELQSRMRISYAVFCLTKTNRR